MVTIDIKQLLREERQKRIASVAAVAQQDSEETQECSTSGPISLDDFAVGADNLVGLFYIPNALTRREEKSILAGLDAVPPNRWVRADGRHTLNFGGQPGSAAVTETLPAFLGSLLDRLQAAGVFTAEERPNHCLVNSYERAGACPLHQDGPLYLDKVITITLGGPALIGFRRSLPDGAASSETAAEVLLRPRCCFVVSGPAYSQHQHGIAGRGADEITELCCNAAAAHAALGQTVVRAERRVSLVFVRKLSVHEQQALSLRRRS